MNSNHSQKLKELIWSGNEANLGLAQQLNDSLGLGLGDFFARLEQCRLEFNQLCKRNFPLWEFIHHLQEADSELYFYGSGDLSDAWSVWAERLQHFAVNQCLWQQIPSWLQPFEQLHSLQIKNSPLQQIADFVFEYPALRRLDLYNSAIQQLPQGLAQAQKLENLTLVSRQKLQLSPQLAQLPALQSLHIGALNSLNPEAIPTPIFDCLGLQELHLQGQCFQHIPAQIHNLTRLEHLELSFCSIQTLSTLRPMTHLHTLSLNAVDYLQEPIAELANLPQLRKLYLVGDYEQMLNNELVRELHFLEYIKIVHFGNFRAGGNQYNAPKLSQFLQKRLPNTVIDC